MKVLHKLFNTQVSSVNDEEKSIEFIISTDEVDRYGDVVDQDSWDFKSYAANPVVLWGHNPDEPENVLGNGSNLMTFADGGVKKTKAKILFDKENSKAMFVFGQLKRAVLRTVSVGFRNHSLEYDEDTPILKDNELLEISVVPIPANAGAIALSFKDGSLHEKDAKWLLESMKKESALLEQQLKTNDKEKSMTEEQAQALIDGNAKLVETVTALTEKVDAQAATIEELKTAAADPEETEEEKTAREAKEQEDANVAAGLNPDGSAKSGTEGDQGGAGEDEFDENTELSPEQEAELDTAFAAQIAELEPAA